MNLSEIQEETHQWRVETIDDELTPLSQAAHTSVEANEVLDILVKGETYSKNHEAREELMKECGDVIIAHLGTMSLLGLDVEDCISAALDKNGARKWESWKAND